jgi:ubiquitin-conjugating enzyme E2 R
MSGESANERWSVLQGAESVLRSILLLLDDPEISSPANVDASVMYRDNREAFKKKAAEDVEKSKADIPAGFVLPTSLEEAPPAKIEDDHDFWADSDAEDDFGASNSSGDDIDMDDFEDDDDDDEGDLENESDEN